LRGRLELNGKEEAGSQHAMCATHYEREREERRWKLVGLLAFGMAIGVTMTATPAVSHVAGWAHNWNEHIKPKADARYANAVRGTDKARNSDKLDGQDSSKFLPAASYTVAGDWTLGVSDPRTNGKKAELSCDLGICSSTGATSPVPSTTRITSRAPGGAAIRGGSSGG
jgi:hypothetical protein